MLQILTKQIQYSNKMIKKIQLTSTHLEMFKASSRLLIKSLKVKKLMIKFSFRLFKTISQISLKHFSLHSSIQSIK
jgi:hypothetical protein